MMCGQDILTEERTTAKEKSNCRGHASMKGCQGESSSTILTF
jgi:hypothetical protein